MKTKTPLSAVNIREEAQLFWLDDARQVCRDVGCDNPDIMWHMEEWIDGDCVEYFNSELTLPDSFSMWVKFVDYYDQYYCVDIYHHLTREWLPLGDLGLLCDEHSIRLAPSFGCGKMEEVMAFVASKPMSKIKPKEKMKGLLLRSLNYYKKFYVPC